MRCPRCSTNLPATARFCLQCGFALPAQEAARPSTPVWQPALSPLVGRDVEMSELTAAGQRLRAGPAPGAGPGIGSVCYIMGDAGVGKSRLVAELRQSMPERDMRWVHVTAAPAGRLRAYGLFVDILQQALGTAHSARETVVRDLCPDIGDEILPYLETLLGQPVPPERAERVRFLQPQELRQQMYRAVYELLVRQARRMPLILVLEDLHWADAASSALLADLIPAITAHPVLVISTLQPESETAALQPYRAVPLKGHDLVGSRYHELRLGALRWVEARVLIDQVFPANALETERGRALALARGNPLHIEVLARLCEEGIPLDAAPEGLAGLLAARVALLDRDQQRTLQLLGVIGERGAVDLVADAARAGGHPEGLEERLRQLSAAGWIGLETEDDRALTYTFGHYQFCLAAYASAPVARRRQLHALVAGEIARRYPAGDEAEVELLAYHYRQAEDRERALDYSLQAAHKAARRDGLDTARAHFIAAQGLAQQLGRAGSLAEIDEALGEIASRQSQIEESEAHFRNALARSPVANSPTAQARVRLKLAEQYEHHGQFLLWMNELRGARHALEDAGLAGSVEWITVVGSMAWAHCVRSEYSAAVERCAEAEAALAELEPAADVQSCHTHLQIVQGLLAQAQGKHRAALEHFARALESAERTGDLNRVATTQSSIGEVLRKIGDPDGAIMHLHAARECYERMGRHDGIIMVDNNVGMAYLQSRNWEAARRLLASALERGKARGYNWLLAETHYGLGTALLELGDIDAARGQATLALTMSEKHGNPRDRACAQRLLARIALRTGDSKGGRLRLRDALRGFEAIGEKREILATLLDLIAASEAAGLAGEAAPLRAQAAQLKAELKTLGDGATG